MRHLLALALKYLLTATVMFAILPLFLRISSAELLWFSLWLTLVAYALGDLYVLPRLGNVSATIADFGLVFVATWIGVGAFYDGAGGTMINAAFFSALLAALGELLFHGYVLRFVIGQHGEEGVPLIGRQWQTEAAEEFDIRTARPDGREDERVDDEDRPKQEPPNPPIL
ncbi:YndM family protein [Geobacillus stearothermophilus]|uniref:YndM family protein n=1 Tax=Geobacillus stearothermophilus TaxID=1422 RepID=UPI000EF46CB3|nr:YndM family protein [Geobacillus stearothermophilus]MED3778182.1 YndM family protein [Geobacillus stearothermophilus]MED3782932.1 YndM family protein [Geobacillus stearothermophilus]MED4869406.1 YndM family protein [Geobacillus stearothermophilus]MED4959873.1 YndM family protein [Geobacillus stearothermophilus]MED4986960.1 YndM family protein [Geobacillus stearothermophilus]